MGISNTARIAIATVAWLATGSAFAETMTGEAARRFVAGKLFAFNCFDGSRGVGRIYADGSAIGTIQINGSGPVRSVWLPANTLRVKGEAVCAALKGLSFEPCFTVSRTSEQSFRGALVGMGLFAYCDFTRRATVAGAIPRAPLSGSKQIATTAVEPTPITTAAVESKPIPAAAGAAEGE